jgi:stress-induced morphogen
VSVAETIRRKLTDRFAPTRLVITDESQRHAGHAGARPDGERQAVPEDRTSVANHVPPKAKG